LPHGRIPTLSPIHPSINKTSSASPSPILGTGTSPSSTATIGTISTYRLLTTICTGTFCSGFEWRRRRWIINPFLRSHFQSRQTSIDIDDPRGRRISLPQFPQKSPKAVFRLGNQSNPILRSAPCVCRSSACPASTVPGLPHE